MNHQDTKTPREPIPKETDKLASKIVDAVFAVHTTLGPGLLESVYEVCLLHELQKRGLQVERQVSLPVVYDGLRLDCGLRLDLVVENRVGTQGCGHAPCCSQGPNADLPQTLRPPAGLVGQL